MDVPLSILFLTPRPAYDLTSTQCLLTSKSHYCLPGVLWATGCIKLVSLQHQVIPGLPQSDHTVCELSADTGSLSNDPLPSMRYFRIIIWIIFHEKAYFGWCAVVLTHASSARASFSPQIAREGVVSRKILVFGSCASAAVQVFLLYVRVVTPSLSLVAWYQKGYS